MVLTLYNNERNKNNESRTSLCNFVYLRFISKKDMREFELIALRLFKRPRYLLLCISTKPQPNYFHGIFLYSFSLNIAVYYTAIMTREMNRKINKSLTPPDRYKSSETNKKTGGCGYLVLTHLFTYTYWDHYYVMKSFGVYTISCLLVRHPDPKSMHPTVAFQPI